MWSKLRNLLLRTPPSKDREEAADAMKSASSDLHAALGQGKEVRRLSSELRMQREVNHFAERIKASLKEA